jgi:hypothetical protein
VGDFMSENSLIRLHQNRENARRNDGQKVATNEPSTLSRNQLFLGDDPLIPFIANGAIPQGIRVPSVVAVQGPAPDFGGAA